MLVQTTSELEHQVNEISVLMENSQFTISAMSNAKNPNRSPQARSRSDKGQHIYRQLQKLSRRPWQVLTCPVHLRQGKGSDKLCYHTMHPPQV